MLLLFVICHFSVFAAANPFHKYPFIFLLDVGNEELEKTNSEQIRVSVPGGSIALRYPAIGDGNTISHIRVSGIDFSTDLKANIVDGGPGYKYVVLVFMGNPGTPYDAVVTVQTIIDTNYDVPNVKNLVNSEAGTYQTEDDKNDSAEDLSDTDVRNNVRSEIEAQKDGTELMQSSSKIYSYANNESTHETEDDEEDVDESNTDDEADNDEVHSDVTDEDLIDKGDFEDVSNTKDVHSQNIDDIDETDPEVQVKGIRLDDDNDEDKENDDERTNQKTAYAEQQPEINERNPYSKYEAIQNHLNYYGNGVYSQEEFQKSSRPVYQDQQLDYVDPYAEEISDETDKYRDFNNNNYVDLDESNAVEY